MRPFTFVLSAVLIRPSSAGVFAGSSCSLVIGSDLRFEDVIFPPTLSDFVNSSPPL